MSQNSQPLDLLRFPLDGLRLIEASAGTGKTYSIAALYVRLVLGHGRPGQVPLVPPEILVLTYTRAATQELRDRIRRRLVEAANVFRTGIDGGDEFVRDLLAEIAHDQHAACAARLQQAAEWMDEAAIHTIHAWCQTMLRQHAFDSGSLFAQDVDSEDRALFDQVVKDYWRRYFYGRDIKNVDLKEIALDPDKLAKALRDLIKPGLVLELKGQTLGSLPPDHVMSSLQKWGSEKEACIAEIRAAWNEQGDEIVALIEGAAEQGVLIGDLNKEDKRCEWLSAVKSWVEKGGKPPTQLKKFSMKAIPRFISQRADPPNALEHPWFEQVQGLYDLPPKPDIAPCIWPHAVAWVRDRYQAEKRRRNRLDFDDLLVNLDQALASENGESLRSRILESFPVALIDEFQDTDPVQYRIFDRVYASARGDERNALVMIGDPKQSIYGFRGADIHTYLAAREKTTAEDRFTLRTNFRSSEAMVEAVNHFFEAGDKNTGGAFGFAETGKNRVPFERVEAAGQDETLIIGGKRLTPLTFWHLTADGGKVDVPDYQQCMAESTAQTIVDLLNGSRDESGRIGFRKSDGAMRPVCPADIAVLVNKGREADIVRSALRKHGVGSVYLSDRDSVFEQREAKDVLAMLEAAAQPMDASRIRRALVTASLCRTLKELETVSSDEGALELEIERFRRLGHVWREHGVLAMLRRLLVEMAVAERLKAIDAGWERQITNLLHLAELLQAESGKRDSAQGLIDWLQGEIARDNRSENDSEIIRLESDEGLVRVITVHKSKGLQYGLVFVPFASYYTSPPSPFLKFHDDEGRRIVEFDKQNPNAKKRSELDASRERIRLLYVAITRAQHACWVGVAKVNQSDNSAPSHLLGKLALEKGQEPDTSAGLIAALNHLADTHPQHITVQDVFDDGPEIVKLLPEDESFEYAPPLDPPNRRFDRWWIASYSSLPRGSGHGVRPAGRKEAAEAPDDDRWQEMVEEECTEAERGTPDTALPEDGTIHAFHRGAAAGTLLHDILEWAGNRGFAEVLQDVDTLRAEIRMRLKRRRWQDHEEVLVEWLQRQLAAPIRLGDRRTHLRDLRPERYQYSCELNFLFATQGIDIGDVDQRVRTCTVQGRDRPPFDPHTIHGMFTGFIDLVFEYEGRWYVADYKSNHLGPDMMAYTRDTIADSILEHRYDMQFVIYELALHRLLKQRLGAAYQPKEHLGGAAYLFLRGCDHPETAGVYFEPADIDLIEALDRMFAGQEVRDVA